MELKNLKRAAELSEKLDDVESILKSFQPFKKDNGAIVSSFKSLVEENIRNIYFTNEIEEVLNKKIVKFTIKQLEEYRDDIIREVIKLK